MVEGRGNNISGKNKKGCSIRMKVNLYEVCLSYIMYCLLFHIMTILTTFFSRFVAFLTQGEVIQELLSTSI